MTDLIDKSKTYKGGLGVLSGKVLMPRDIAAAGIEFWHNYELTKMIATALGESAGYLGAFHDNYDPTNTVIVSRDCGLMQDNIPAAEIGTPVEDGLRTESFDPAVYGPIVEHNVHTAWDLYNEPWVGRPIRLWQPWVAYTTGWATFPAWWIWHQDTSGNAVGPWIPTGRYIHRAIAGQMNNHIVNLKDWTVDYALRWGQNYAREFGIDPSLLYVTSAGILSWHIPPKPTEPPADGVGPRPVANNGE
jgi:hypothetical protein